MGSESSAPAAGLSAVGGGDGVAAVAEDAMPVAMLGAVVDRHRNPGADR